VTTVRPPIGRPDFTPIYYRIEESLRSRIAAGEFREGDALPSESELTRAFNTTRGTVRQALSRLVFEGIIVREVGRGTFVSRPRVQSSVGTSIQRSFEEQSFEEQMTAKGAAVTLKVLGFDRVPAPARVAETLGLGRAEPVYRLERLRLVDGELVGLEVRYLVEALGARIPRAALETASAVALVEQTLGISIGTMALTLRASRATRELSRKLKVSPGSALLISAHTYFDLDDRPILCGEAIYRGDKFQISYTLRADQARAVRPSPKRTGVRRP
jgi:GntR family transcriptional regulator